MRTPSTLRRTVLVATFAVLALLASACGGQQQPIEVGGGGETDESTDTLEGEALAVETRERDVPNPIPEPSDLDGTDDGDDSLEPTEVPGPDASGEFKGTEPIDDSDDPNDGPDIGAEPLVADDPPVPPEPEQQDTSPISAKDLAQFCASYDALNELGEDDPVSAAEAETMIAEMVELAKVLSISAPDHMAAGAAEVTDFLDTVAELAAAADWAPEWFEGSSDEVFADSNLDFELLEEFFSQSDDLCLEPGGLDHTTPDVAPVE